jgi:hypothetical protein
MHKEHQQRIQLGYRMLLSGGDMDWERMHAIEHHTTLDGKLDPPRADKDIFCSWLYDTER